MCRFCLNLDSDGFVVLEDALPAATLCSLQTVYTSAWLEILEHWKELQWRTRSYYADCQPSTRFVGVALYDGYRSSEYKDTEVLDMGRGRFDFSYGLQPFEKETIPMPAALDEIARCQLKFEYGHFLGGLPVMVAGQEEGSSSSNSRDGTWHRDAYSLFDDESLDLKLPTFYLTVLIPLVDVLPGDSATEFIVGSHKLNLKANGLQTKEQLEVWAEQKRAEGQVKSVALKAGSLCVFHGLTVHRGRAATSSDPAKAQHSADTSPSSLSSSSMRDMIYCVFKKNWYNDEPSSNYAEN